MLTGNANLKYDGKKSHINLHKLPSKGGGYLLVHYEYFAIIIRGNIPFVIYITCAELIESQATPDPNTMVGCTTESNCEGSSVTSTIKDCCDHDIEPIGFTYTIPGEDGCQLCPVGKGK